MLFRSNVEMIHVKDINKYTGYIRGGVLYTIGGVIYAIKSDKIRIGAFGGHEIFHIFIMQIGRASCRERV